MTMKSLTLETIARVTGGTYCGPDADRAAAITGVVTDNRKIEPGNLFVCISGSRTDGHSFAAAAYAAGAAACLAEKPLETDNAYILVESTLEAIKALAAYYRSLFTIPVIGIIGSVGKTTAKEMTAAVLSERFNTLKTEANLNNELGVPLTLLRLREEHEAAVVEMGISDFGEMSRLGAMVRPDMVVMTAIGYCHLEQLKDLDGVLRAKSEVFNFMKPEALAVLNGDDVKLSSFEPGIAKVTFGLDSSNTYYASNVVNNTTDGIDFTVNTPDSRFAAHIPGFGSHLTLAALAAVAIGRALGVTDEETSAGIGKYGAVGGRANVSETEYVRIIDDCYNANPNSVSASLIALSAVEGRKVAILGDMKELGSKSRDLHRAVGVLAVEQGIDCVICCGAEAEFIYKGIISTGEKKECWCFPMTDALISVLPSLIKKGDTVLVKASHSMHFEVLVEELRKLK